MNRRAIVGAMVVVAALVAVGAAMKPHGTSAARSYCRTVQVGHTTMLNTAMKLGTPDSTVTHDGFRYLAYGKVTFVYAWLGSQDRAVLSGVAGC